jgi:hypothetical protein
MLYAVGDIHDQAGKRVTHKNDEEDILREDQYQQYQNDDQKEKTHRYRF